jgi:hypothetical protein
LMLEMNWLAVNLMGCILLCTETRIFYVAINTTTILSFLENYKFLFDEIHSYMVWLMLMPSSGITDTSSSLIYLVAEVMSEILTDTHTKSWMHMNTYTRRHAHRWYVLIMMMIGVIIN